MTFAHQTDGSHGSGDWHPADGLQELMTIREAIQAKGEARCGDVFARKASISGMC